MLVSLVLINGFYFSEQSYSVDYLNGFKYIILSNTCFLINIHSQNTVCKAIGTYDYYLITVPITLFLEFAMFFFLDRNRTETFKQIIDFSKRNFLFLILCGLSGATFYIFSSFFIDKYSPLYFNIASLSSSSFSGIIFLVAKLRKHGTHRKAYGQILVYVTIVIIGGWCWGLARLIIAECFKR